MIHSPELLLLLQISQICICSNMYFIVLVGKLGIILDLSISFNIYIQLSAKFTSLQFHCCSHCQIYHIFLRRLYKGLLFSIIFGKWKMCILIRESRETIKKWTCCPKVNMGTVEDCTSIFFCHMWGQGFCIRS